MQRRLLVLFCTCLAPAMLAGGGAKHYAGTPYPDDGMYAGGPQAIPGKVQCAYYDVGGEGVAYHDVDPVNHGSGELNPANGTYLNEFRMKEGVDISYVKHRDDVNYTEDVDNNPYGKLVPPKGQLYVGWTEPGEWFNMTVTVQRGGRYRIDLLYTSNRGGSISLDLDGKKLTEPIDVPTTYNEADPVAWRQWHHWNVLRDMAEVTLPKGTHVLTLHTLTKGNMNYATLDFTPADSKPSGAK
jgi:hypothetical protein